MTIHSLNGEVSMGEAKEKLLPGTVAAYVERGEKGFSKIEMLLDATGGLSLSQVCAVTGLEGSTIQNWVKRGWVSHPMSKKYEDIHIARILIINALKECIKLENIALLMGYVKGSGAEDSIIKESELYNYLCDALDQIGRTADQSRSGVEAVVEKVIRDYTGPTPDSRIRIRKALILMIFACVCTDVKRRTETMMDQILNDLAHPENLEAQALQDLQALQVSQALQEALEEQNPIPEEEPQLPPETRHPSETETSYAARKTVSQALREWDFSSVERVIIDPDAGNTAQAQQPSEADKAQNRPWYLRRGSK